MERYKKANEGIHAPDDLKKAVLKSPTPARRRYGWTAVAAVLVIALLAGALPGLVNSPDDSVAADPGTVETTDPQPSESEYDVFSDPNVLWGGEDTGSEGISFLKIDPNTGKLIYAEINIRPVLLNLLDDAKENELLAFRVEAFFSDLCVPVENVTIPDELDPQGEIRALVEKCRTAISADEREMIVTEFFEWYREIFNNDESKYTLLMSEYTQMVEKETNAVYHEWVSDKQNDLPDDPDERAEWELKQREKARQEAHTRLQENDRYQELEVALAPYRKLEESVFLAETTMLRERLIGKFGLTPIYNTLEECPAGWELAFVAAAEQILKMEELRNPEEETYHLFSVSEERLEE